jgi:hypothetical protein
MDVTVAIPAAVVVIIVIALTSPALARNSGIGHAAAQQYPGHDVDSHHVGWGRAGVLVTKPGVDSVLSASKSKERA